jgi:transposase
VEFVPLWGDECTKSRPPYPPEFRQRIIELVRKGRTPESLAEQFEPTAQTIRNWLAQADRDAGQRSDGLTTDEREELRRRRRENKTLREEREILKKAAAWFAKETGSIPSKDRDPGGASPEWTWRPSHPYAERGCLQRSAPWRCGGGPCPPWPW